MPRILYKYLDIEGAKYMLGNKNLQFTTLLNCMTLSIAIQNCLTIPMYQNTNCKDGYQRDGG